jgi:hypothetical protein
MLCTSCQVLPIMEHVIWSWIFRLCGSWFSSSLYALIVIDHCMWTVRNGTSGVSLPLSYPLKTTFSPCAILALKLIDKSLDFVRVVHLISIFNATQTVGFQKSLWRWISSVFRTLKHMGPFLILSDEAGREAGWRACVKYWTFAESVRHENKEY